MREEFVKRVLNGKGTKSGLCREYGISRPTGDKWIRRYQEEQSLEDRSRKPAHTRRVDPAIEQEIIDYRTEHPAIGALKIHRILTRQGTANLPCVKTVNNILKRNGLITQEASRAATPCKRFEHEKPNDMWQADYKGHFTLQNGEVCHPLNIIDDHSRFNLCCEALHTETFEEIMPVMKRLFQTYGLPTVFLCDNGNPWGTSQSTGFTKFEVWLMELGILTIHGRALHPQTQGKEESFNRSLTKELLNHRTLRDMQDAQKQFDHYRRFYNEERPHHALDLDTPKEHYQKSDRRYTEQIKPWIYAPDCEIRTVKETGYFNWAGQGYYLSEAFGGKEIAVRKSHLQGCVSLFFRQFRIGRIDLEQRVFTLKKAFLIEDDPRFKV